MMYRTAGIPANGIRRRTAAYPFGLARIVHRRFSDGTARIDDDFSVRHLSDLAGGYGVAYRRDIAERAAANTFTSMAVELLEAVSAPDGPIGVVLVAHATPDVDCRLAATTYLTDALPDSALVFGVSDGGRSTPYTALRLAGGYASRHGYERALVLLMDQSTLPYDIESPDGRPAGDAAVGMLLRRGCPTGIGLRQLAGVQPAELPAAVEALLRGLTGPAEPVAVIAGTGIDPDRDLPARAEAVWCAPTGYPCTSTWEGLARHLGVCTGGRVVLLDYDRATGDLSACSVDRPVLEAA